MRAAYYESVGPALDVMMVGERPTPQAQAGEVRIPLVLSGGFPVELLASRHDARLYLLWGDGGTHTAR
jgi:NADPH:quinone reductase-like Zn-dependent oxidoreductase